MIPVQAIAPIAEGIVKLLSDYVKSTQEPDAEVVAAFRRITRIVHEAQEILDAVPPITLRSRE